MCTTMSTHSTAFHLLNMSTKMHEISSTNQMEAVQTSTNHSKQHCHMCEASRTKDLTDSEKRGESSRFQKRVRFFFEREEVETDRVFLISRLKTFGLEDTSGKKIQSQVFYIETDLNSFSLFTHSCCVNRFRYYCCFFFFFLFFHFVFHNSIISQLNSFIILIV